ISGFDGIPFAEISNPSLTTVVQPAGVLGETGANALFHAIDTGEAPQDHLLEVSLAVRESSQARRTTGWTRSSDLPAMIPRLGSWSFRSGRRPFTKGSWRPRRHV